MCTIQNTCHLWKVHFSSVLIWYFYIHCILDLFASDAQGSICEICLTNLVSFLGFLDSLWIYLFGIPYGSTCSIYGHIDLFALCDSEISILRGGHYTTLHCWTKPHARRAQPVQCAGWGCSLFKMITTGNYSNVRWRSSSFYGSLGFILLLCTELLLLIIWHLLSI